MIKKIVLLEFLKENIISSFDYHIANFLKKESQNKSDDFALIIAYLSLKLAEGDTCINLNDPIKLGNITKKISLNVLFDSGLVTNNPDKNLPLIIDSKNRLFFKKYWHYEKKIAQILLKKAQYFYRDKKLPKFHQFSYQNLAVVISLLKNLTIISGGPGTGKTTTIAKIVENLQHIDKKVKIAIASPTGKATSRISEVINDKNIKISTIHRLLRFYSNGLNCYYNEYRKLPYDVVIIDEVSMVNLVLMYKLLISLKEKSKLIILGDKDQLYSVEAGAVLGEICSVQDMNSFSFDFISEINKLFSVKIDNKLTTLPKEQNSTEIIDCMVELRQSYRFSTDKGIGLISSAIRKSDFNLFLSSIDNKEIYLIETKNKSWFIKSEIIKIINEHYQPLTQISTPEQGFKILKNFKILTPYKKGLSGTNFINNFIKQKILNISDSQEWYNGKPVIIEENDYIQNLFNGDIGITVENKVFFEKDNKFIPFMPSILPANSPVFAMTIHKSQGSEYDTVMIIIENNEEDLFLTREILYTAVTRARNKIFLCVSSIDIIEFMLKNKTKRNSGLSDFLFNKNLMIG